MSAARKSVLTLAAHLLAYAQALVLTPVVIKIAGPEIYGAYVLLISYMSILFGISSMGIGVSAKRCLPSTSDAVGRATRFYPQFWFQMISVFVLASVSAVTYTVLATLRHWHLPGFSAWLVPGYLLACALYSQTTDYLRYTHRVAAYNIFTSFQPVLFVSFVLGIYWATDSLSPGTLVASLIITWIILGSIIFRDVYTEIGLQLRLPKRYDIGKEIVLGFPLVLSYLVDVILSSGDRYIIAMLLSVRDVGIYVPAYALGSLVMVFPKAIGVVLPPLISQRIDEGDEKGAKRLFDGASRAFLLVSVPYVVGALILGREVLRLYANNEIAEAAWPVIPIVAFASIFYGLILIKSNLLFVRLKTRALFQINLISAVLNIVLNIVLIKLFGNVIVAAIATLASYMLSYMMLGRYLAGDTADFVLNKWWLLRVLTCSAGMALALIILIRVFAYQGLLAVGVGVLIGVAVYMALTLLQHSNRAELASLLQSIKTR